MFSRGDARTGGERCLDEFEIMCDYFPYFSFLYCYRSLSVLFSFSRFASSVYSDSICGRHHPYRTSLELFLYYICIPYPNFQSGTERNSTGSMEGEERKGYYNANNQANPDRRFPAGRSSTPTIVRMVIPGDPT